MAHAYQVWFPGEEDFPTERKLEGSGSRTAKECLVRRAFSRLGYDEGPKLEEALRAYGDVTHLLIPLVEDDFPLLYEKYEKEKGKS